MTNGDKIRNMTDEELASFIYETIEETEWDEDGGNNNYEDNWLEWIKEKAKAEKEITSINSANTKEKYFATLNRMLNNSLIGILALIILFIEIYLGNRIGADEFTITVFKVCFGILIFYVVIHLVILYMTYKKRKKIKEK